MFVEFITIILLFSVGLQLPAFPLTPTPFKQFFGLLSASPFLQRVGARTLYEQLTDSLNQEQLWQQPVSSGSRKSQLTPWWIVTRGSPADLRKTWILGFLRILPPALGFSLPSSCWNEAVGSLTTWGMGPRWPEWPLLNCTSRPQRSGAGWEDWTPLAGTLPFGILREGGWLRMRFP